MPYKEGQRVLVKGYLGRAFIITKSYEFKSDMTTIYLYDLISEHKSKELKGIRHEAIIVI